jgi:ABC-type branched-subunit amino acid transport system substrate-binding protein
MTLRHDISEGGLHVTELGDTKAASWFRRGRVKAVVPLLALSMVIAACGSSGTSATSATSAPKGPYVIGLTTNIGPANAAFFNPVNGALTAYVKYVNSQGGVNGRQLKLITLNDNGDPSQAVTNFGQLQADGAVIILCNTQNTAVTPLISKAQAAHIPMVWTTLNDGTPTPYVYGYAPDTPDSTVAQLNFAVAHLLNGAPPKVAFVGAGDPVIGAEVQTALTKRIAAIPGGKFVASEVLPLTSTSFTVGAEKIKAAGANVIISAEAPGADKVLYTGLQAAGLSNVPVVGYSFSYSIANLKSVNDPNFYVYYYALDPTTSNAALAPMLAQAKTAGTSTAIGAQYTEFYALSVAIVSALKHCGANCTGATLNTELTSSATHSTTGGITTPVGFTDGNHSFAQEVQFVHLGSAADIADAGGLVTVGNSFRQ